MHSAYYLRAAGKMGGGMIVVVKCRGEEVGNKQLGQTRRLTHNNCGALVNVHDVAHRGCLDEGKSRFTLDCPIECRAFNFKKSESYCAPPSVP